MMRALLWAGIGLGFLASSAMAGPENVGWPADYKSSFSNYFNGDRTANGHQVIRIFANDVAQNGAAADGKLPYGSVIVAELYSVKMDENEEAVESLLGRRIIDSLKAVVVMERGEGFDAEYSDELTVGDWEFAVFKPSGERVEKDVTGCRECHHELTDTEHLYSYEHLIR
jgi:hypothetical protein